MRIVDTAVRQPITVAVGVILAVLAGILALTSVPIRMAPEVESVVISVGTAWENASPQEIESDVIEEQEQRLGDLSNLVALTSLSQAGRGQLRLEFRTGTDIDQALAEVDQKLSEVPGYPLGVDEPVLEGVDPESVDYIAWIGLASTDPNFDPSTLYDFMERRIRPHLERVPGIAEIGIRGAREAEVQIRVDPEALAFRGITYAELVDAIQVSNENYSGGKLPEGKSDIRIRAVGRFHDPETVQDLVVRRESSGPIYLRDLAEVTLTYKEPLEWVRARGHRMPFFNAQLEQGANLLETMAELKAITAQMNEPGGILEQKSRTLGLDGRLELVQTYDATSYVEDALTLVQNNILVGGALATLTLLLFLRSLRTIGVIAIAIPISVVASVAVLVLLGRSVNIISLAGMAFAVGMVVDNAIVVIENIFRHLEMGKSPRRAAQDGTTEVGGAVLASTLTTLVVFLPILTIQEQAGQLFRDIALAIMAAVGLSLVVALTVIPSASALLLKRPTSSTNPNDPDRRPGPLARLGRFLWSPIRWAGRFPEFVAWGVTCLTGGWIVRLTLVVSFAVVTLGGIWMLMPPLDYLPQGNRNVVFSVLIPPPDYNVEQLSEVGRRMEERIRPAWELAGPQFGIEERQLEEAGRLDEEPTDNRIAVPAGFEPDAPMVVPPVLEHYFLVAWEGRVFQVAISADKKRVVDALPLFNYSVADEAAPDVISFAFQMPLFQTGGTTGSAIKVDLIGDDLDRVGQGAGALMGALIEQFGPYSVTPEPANFMLPTPEIRVVPDDERLREMGMARRDVGLAVQAGGDGILLPRQFEMDGELKDLKIINRDALSLDPITAMLQAPLATPTGNAVDLESIAEVARITETNQIKHVDRQRAITLQLTPPPGLPLEQAITQVNGLVEGLREQEVISPDIQVQLAGSAGQLAEVKQALLGDGSVLGIITSSLFLAVMVVYLLMVVLFQSWSYPLVIMVTVPLATFGGFLGLALVHNWSQADRYMPVQNLDVLTILGFVILTGIVVNNAILLVHQSLNLLSGRAEDVDASTQRGLTAREAIALAVKSRVRPILMSTLTSIGGMLPLVLMPGSGSELYRGLGAVVVGGLLFSTVFTLVLVPVLLSIVFAFRRNDRDEADHPTPSNKHSELAEHNSSRHIMAEPVGV